MYVILLICDYLQCIPKLNNEICHFLITIFDNREREAERNSKKDTQKTHGAAVAESGLTRRRRNVSLTLNCSSEHSSTWWLPDMSGALTRSCCTSRGAGRGWALRSITLILITGAWCFSWISLAA